MKHSIGILLSFILLLLAGTAIGQKDGENKGHIVIRDGGDKVIIDTTKKGRRIIIIDSEDETDTIEIDLPSMRDNKKEGKRTESDFFFDLGVNGYMEDGSTKLSDKNSGFALDYSKSIGVAFNQLYSTRIIGQWFRIAYGYGFDIKNYRLKEDVTFTNVKDSIIPMKFAIDEADLYKNKFVTGDFHIPLMLHLKLGKDSKKKFNLAAGAEAAYVFGSKVKQKYRFDGDKKKYVDKGSYDINPFQLRGIARVGFGKLSIFGKYSFSPMFESEQNPDLRTFAVGVSLIGF